MAYLSVSRLIISSLFYLNYSSSVISLGAAAFGDGFFSYFGVGGLGFFFSTGLGSSGSSLIGLSFPDISANYSANDLGFLLVSTGRKDGLAA